METLIQLLITCEILLQSAGEAFWADKIHIVLKKYRGNLDFYLLKEILSWYGGVGSFNDFMISEYNGHLVKRKDEEKLNDELNHIRNQIYQEVMRLKQG